MRHIQDWGNIAAGAHDHLDLGADAYKNEFVMNAMDSGAVSLPATVFFLVNGAPATLPTAADQLSEPCGTTRFRPMGSQRYVHVLALANCVVTVSRIDEGGR
jgi:hypothetical protein